MKITGEKIFSVPEHFFSISGSTSGYTLNYGNDGYEMVFSRMEEKEAKSE